MSVFSLPKLTLIVMLVASLGLFGQPLHAQSGDIAEEEAADLAFAQSGQTWVVTETVGSERWDATWTLRKDGKTFDAHWKHHPGGKEGDLHGFAKIVSIRGSNIIIERPGLGRYSGTISADRTRITGKMSWAAGTWKVRLEPGALSNTSESAPSIANTLPKTKWSVTESVGNEKWQAEWVVRKDGRSFDADWTHTPGNDTGRLTNFAQVTSIKGNQITIKRPGLGTYTGVISKDRRSINGSMSWAKGTWRVTVGQPLPSSLR
jgi:hypothetical protein